MGGMAASFNSTLRAFIGFPIPDPARQVLNKIQMSLKREKLNARWTKPGSFHVTLKFLGSIRLGAVAEISSVLTSVSGQYPGLELTTGSLGLFPGIKKARIAWAGIGGQTERLSQLFRQIDGALNEIGYPLENLRFSPHVTLARIKKPVRPDNWVGILEQNKNLRSDPFKLKEIILYESRLSSTGAVHHEIGATKL